MANEYADETVTLRCAVVDCTATVTYPTTRSVYGVDNDPFKDCSVMPYMEGSSWVRYGLDHVFCPDHRDVGYLDTVARHKYEADAQAAAEAWKQAHPYPEPVWLAWRQAKLEGAGAP